MNREEIIEQLRKSGNFRQIPQSDAQPGLIDLSSNDYLGLAQDRSYRHQLLEYALEHDLSVASSASRLLAAEQREYSQLEGLLQDLYPGRAALMYNSGYHANTGIISAVATRDTLVIADRLVHASIIDGIVLSRAKMVRFRHNDYDQLEQLVSGEGRAYSEVLIVCESVYSMDGDKADLERLAQAKALHPNALLYVDEAHAIGVEGPQGRGCVAAMTHPEAVDVMVGTFGKALAGTGAFAAVSEQMRDYLVNKSRSLIFSTALPPVVAAWNRLSTERMLAMDAERAHLRELAHKLSAILGNDLRSHIQPCIAGSAERAVAMSERLLKQGVKALPIRTPTVPLGTERLRFSLSAAIPALDFEIQSI